MLFDKKILAVDDDSDNLTIFKLLLNKSGYQVVCAASGKKALEKVRETFFPIALLDVRMPGMDGIKLLQKIKEISPETMVTLITAYGRPDDIRRAYQAKVFDFIDKPVDNKLLILKVKAAYEQFLIQSRNSHFRKKIMHRYPAEAIVHKGSVMRALLDRVEKLAQSEETILILGESGTGKELVARAVHWFSPRRDKIFRAINATTFDENLLASELFGHEKGAFTGAEKTRIGFFERCHRGTLFLDEIGDISPAMQAKLLRVVEEKKLIRMGSSDPIDVDTRVILATNRDLEKKIKAKEFREDLYYRIKTFTITVPPLRERKTDIPLLINFMLSGHDVKISDETVKTLLRYDYPGNVRELEIILKNALFNQENGTIEINHLPPDVSGKIVSGSGYNEIFQEKWSQAKADFEKLYIEQLMKQADGVVARAARLSGIDRSDLHRKLRRYGIKYHEND
ncbi:MAG: sigma-54-dependent Fis family transcriptional regulator [Calditrichaeota bacterium]|nr:sigma-54-dependent Fis family transcriptional regulator [Calditrichota bacterium]